MSTRPRVSYVIRQLGRGGSEKRLYHTLRNLHPDRIDAQVITLVGGAYEEKIRELGVPLVNLSSAGKGLFRLRAVYSQIRNFQPNIVHGMDSGGYYGRVAARLLRIPVIISGFNGSRLPSRSFRWIESALSRVTDLLISNSYAGRQYLVDTVGVDVSRVRVLLNGFDFDEARDWKSIDLHNELGLRPEQPIVGMVARLMDVKNPFLFIEAAAAVHKASPHTQFVIVGGGPMEAQVAAAIEIHGLKNHFTLLGERSDAVNLIPSFAVGVLTSRAEGLPNALLEYMFWERPSVVTEVGDCGRIVRHGETGYLVPPSDSEGLAEAVVSLLRNRETAKRLGRAARHDLEQKFSLISYCDSLVDLYGEALTKARVPAGDSLEIVSRVLAE